MCKKLHLQKNVGKSTISQGPGFQTLPVQVPAYRWHSENVLQKKQISNIHIGKGVFRQNTFFKFTPNQGFFQKKQACRGHAKCRKTLKGRLKTEDSMQAKKTPKAQPHFFLMAVYIRMATISEMNFETISGGEGRRTRSLSLTFPKQEKKTTISEIPELQITLFGVLPTNGILTIFSIAVEGRLYMVILPIIFFIWKTPEFSLY